MSLSPTPWGYDVDGELSDLISLEEFHARTGNQLVNDERIRHALSDVSDKFRSHCGWHIAGSHDCEVTLDGGERSVWLPATHVTAISCVTVLGEDVTGGCQWSRRGLLRLPYSPDVLGAVTVAYTAGLATVPEGLAGLVVNRVLHQIMLPLGVQSETIGTTSRAYAKGAADGPGSADLAPSDVSALSAYRLWEV